GRTRLLPAGLAGAGALGLALFPGGSPGGRVTEGVLAFRHGINLLCRMLLNHARVLWQKSRARGSPSVETVPAAEVAGRNHSLAQAGFALDKSGKSSLFNKAAPAVLPRGAVSSRCSVFPEIRHDQFSCSLFAPRPVDRRRDQCRPVVGHREGCEAVLPPDRRHPLSP